MEYDFSGWATRANIKCSDGRIIMKDAFKHNDGQKVPLVWNHQHNDPNEVLGYALLENRPEGVYAFGKFNDTESGQTAKLLVEHGDIDSLSIYANQLRENKKCVTHGNIREVSLVLAGANIGAHIDNVISHGEEINEEAYIFTGESLVFNHYDDSIGISHAEESVDGKNDNKKSKVDENKTVKDVIDTMNEEQKKVLYGLLGAAAEESGLEEGDDSMKHNIFDNDENNGTSVLSHADIVKIVSDGKRYGSLKDAFLAHAEEYGIENIDTLFPEPTNINNPPEFIQRDMTWVDKVMRGVHHSPFSRVKSTFADITEDEARAKGYIKGKLKKEEVFSLLKRTTAPTTVYKKQKMDRDDMIDITDFDVIAWIKAEMRMMLDEELARAYLIGDGRLASDDDHINTDNIRPILNDADLFVIRWKVASGSSDDERAKNFIRACIKSRKNYKGSGSPKLFTTEDMLTDMLLLEDTIGHKLYKSESELATTLRVSEIVTVPVMEGLTDSSSKNVYGIIVNLNDYNVGADKGGSINMFEDFDIDYNQQKYLIETRCSGALVKPFSAIVLRAGDSTASEEPTIAEATAEFK